MKRFSTCTPVEHATLRLITMVAYEGAEVIDVTGPLDVFALANHIQCESGAAEPLYRIEIAAKTGDGIIVTSSGIRLLSDRAWGDCSGIDTLLVPGGPAAEQAPEELVDWVRQMAPVVRRVGSICTGAFILARAGLLDGRRATTHWSRAEQLRRRHPQIEVDEDAIHAKDGSVYTSAGITAGIDLALALVEEDHGKSLALDVARLMVLYFKRPGGQSQFSTPLLAQFREGGSLAPTLQWMQENYRRDLDNETLAAHAAMSLRNFARIFKREVGTTPARFIEQIRLEAAVKLLEETSQSVEAVARECGFQSGEHLRLTFARRFGITPGQYRARFRSETG
ncbi:GlxA family transcriptional regulator [Geomonas subterranea]|uniref:GlxA family transcriptional regulator n=1 Tax=Geomonas subterranea TaxID=2847989 RepID=A0ABX8LI23_9BACT|nr:GlxA family transcriptional regulator [Geomonas subterranea]QXE89235.1 GlxA family transcriptional regulator [Geomonas subterranea]QXM08653.1 GlxA family transcriptional regulator [Geomonas subterranea]